MEVDKMNERNIDNILPTGTPILIDMIKYYMYKAEPIYNNVDIDILKKFRYSNPYVLFLDKHELKYIS